ncbi:dihydrodipicolinate synthase [Whalleya microplaca]|nr:dihydrodipicolinate synthase [Whalleya microplaca]
MTARISTPKAKPLPLGVYTPVITIYEDTPEQAVNYEAMYKHGQYLVNSGMHGLVYLGTNGEMALLTREERSAIIRNAVKAVTDLGLPDYPIVAGISAQSTGETIRYAKEAGEAGAAFGLLLPPSYWSKALGSDALIGYFRDVADASPIPIIIYNFPGVTSGIDLDSDQLSTLAAHPNIVATKLTCGNVGKLTRLTAKFEPAHFGVYGGSSDFLLPTLHAGGVGCVTGLGNVFPKSTSQIYDLFVQGKLEEARQLQNQVAAAEWACKKSLACTKYGTWAYVGKQLGLTNPKMFNMRKPYLELGDSLKKWSVDTMKILEDVENALPGRQR